MSPKSVVANRRYDDCSHSGTSSTTGFRRKAGEQLWGWFSVAGASA